MASVVDLKSKEEKDAELDRKIEALRRKNEALMKRHKLIEEDKKMAEQEGNAVTTPRKIKISDGEPDKARKEKENFSITLDVSAGEKRIVSEGKFPQDSHTPTRTKTSPRSPTQRTSGRTGAYPGGRSPQFDRSSETFKFDNDNNIHPSERMERGRRRQGAEGPNRGPRVAKETPSVEQWTPSSRGGRGPGRGRGGDTPGRRGGHIVNTEGTPGTDRKVKEWEEKRKQNIEKMNEEMEQIAEYERHQRDGVREKNPIRNFLDDPRRTGPIAEVDRKEGSRRHNRNWGGQDFEKVKTGMDREKESHVRRPGGRNQMDMTLSMTGRERAEYMRWKQEREQIDQERLARHRKPTGQWRREWDAEKTDTMFKDGTAPHIEDEPMGRRDLDKRGAPKPATIAEFLPRSLPSSGEKRHQKRGRERNKPYSMHDSRWEDDDDEEEVNEKDKILPVEEKEKETCVEETEETKVEGAQKNTSKAPKPMVDEKKDEFKHGEKEYEEGEEDDEDEEEWTDASGDEEEADEDGSEVEEDSIEEASKASPASPKEQRLPQQRETPKLTMPPPNVNNEEADVESKPISPFSPDGHQPVTDWGEEMELLSPPGSSNEDSPPQVVNRKVFTMDSRSHSGSTQNPTLDPEDVVASNVESSSLQSPEVQTGQKQEPVASNVESSSLQSPEVQTGQKQEPVASSVESSSLQSPEVQTGQKQEPVASNVESSSLQSPEVQTGQKQEPVASNVESSSLQSPEVQTGQKQEPVASNVESSSLQSPEVQTGQKQEPMASNVESSSFQSPELQTDQKQEPMASNVESSSFQSQEVQTDQKQEPVASSIESSPLPSPEVQSDQKQEPVKESSGGEPLPGAPVLSQERDPDSSKNQGERVEEISEVSAETSLAVEEASSVQEQSSPVQEQSSPVQEQSSPVPEQSSAVKEQNSPSTGEALPVKDETAPPTEDLEGTIKAVHIADFETQSTEMPQSS